MGRYKGLSLVLDSHTDLLAAKSVGDDWAGFLVAVAGPDEFPLVERRSYVMRPGSEHFVSLSAVDTVATAGVRKLETHGRGCYFPEELQLRFHSNYSQVPA